MQTKRNDKGISPAVTSVIIMATALLVSVALAYWTITIVPVYAKHEEIRITGCFIESENVVVITLENTGSFDVTLDYVLINGVSPNKELTPSTILKLGEKTTIGIDLSFYSILEFKAGVRYDFIIHTNNGGRYPTLARAY